MKIIIIPPHYRVLFALLAVTSALSLYATLVEAPFSYPVGSTITIPSGMTIAEAGAMLKQEHVIHSSVFFSLFVRVTGGTLIAGTYALPEKKTIFEIAYDLERGITGIEQVRVTIPEGATNLEIAKILGIALQPFDTQRFLTLAQPDEGYLFPDTYFLLPGTPPEQVIERMKQNFDFHIRPLEGELGSWKRSLKDAVIMASIVEKEARKIETRQVVAGILWSRVDSNMYLQVDAVFGYIFQKPTFSPSLDDLKVNSPYNTYTHRGLPPGPIGNPGLDALKAAINPVQSPYLFYLTGKDGIMYYAKTFKQHLANRAHLK